MPKKNKYCTSIDLAKKLAKQEKIELPLAKKVVDLYFDQIQKILLAGDRVKLSEFGIFSITSWNVKEIFDINIGQRVEKQIKSVKFKPSESLKRKVLEN